METAIIFIIQSVGKAFFSAGARMSHSNIWAINWQAVAREFAVHSDALDIIMCIVILLTDEWYVTLSISVSYEFLGIQ